MKHQKCPFRWKGQGLEVTGIKEKRINSFFLNATFRWVHRGRFICGLKVQTVLKILRRKFYKDTDKDVRGANGCLPCCNHPGFYNLTSISTYKHFLQLFSEYKLTPWILLSISTWHHLQFIILLPTTPNWFQFWKAMMIWNLNEIQQIHIYW